MIDALPLLLGPEGYQISRSVRLRSSASAYFGRTPASTTNRTTWTWSGWVKRGSLGSNSTIFSAGTGSAIDTNWLAFLAGDFLAYSINDGTYYLQTTQVFRDPSAWYHIVLATDTTQATASNRTKLYVNGIQITAFSTANYPDQNHPQLINTSNLTVIGAKYRTAVQDYFDGYITEVNFIDGQALDPSSFGETNPVTGVWQPKKYAGTYGTNGFYLNFSDNSAATAAAIGKDNSGNANNWTPNNISVTAGVSYDSMLDVPTQWADGGNGRGNYATLNPINKPSTATIYNASLYVDFTSSGGEQPATIAVSSGKWYWESVCGNQFVALGIIPSTARPSASSFASGYHYYGSNGNFYTGVSAAAYGATLTTNDVVGVALDLDTNQITFYKNGVSQGAKSIVADTYFPDFAAAAATTNAANFGQRPFTYTPPSGFKALNTLNLPTPTILKGNQYFDAKTYTGTGATQTITVDFASDFAWLKRRDGAGENVLMDRLRLTGSLPNRLFSNSTSAESTAADGQNSFSSTGIVLDGSGSGGEVNTSGRTYVGWQWKEGPTQGFDIVTYTGTGSNTTVAHNLGVAPKMIIFRARSIVENWPTWHANLTSAAHVLTLNTTNAQASVPQVMNSTAPTSSVFSVGTSTGSNGSGTTYVAYLFSEVAGFSRIGSYTGNNSTDGPFCFTGFLPRWVMIKRTDAVSSWVILDTARNTANVMNSTLWSDLSSAEGTFTIIDSLSNGFKLRESSNGYNVNNGSYIFAAFASNPFKHSLAR